MTFANVSCMGHPKPKYQSAWEIGQSHYDQRDLYTVGESTSDDGYRQGPKEHPQLGSYSYTRPEPKPRPSERSGARLSPERRREVMKDQAWPWRMYENRERLTNLVHGRVTHALERQSVFDARNIHVIVKVDVASAEGSEHAPGWASARITLRGKVADPRCRRLAEIVARSCWGVEAVNNMLTTEEEERSRSVPPSLFAR